MRVQIDRDRCIGTGMCLGVAPEVFDIDDEYKSYLVRDDDLSDVREGVEEAVKYCPTDALTIIESD